MPDCPNCDTLLQRSIKYKKMIYRCKKCNGYLVSIANLRHQCSDQKMINDLWNEARNAPHNQGKECAYCSRSMSSVKLHSDSVSIDIDICSHCLCFWFDDHEFGLVPMQTKSEKPELKIEEKYKKELLPLKLHILKQNKDELVEMETPRGINFIFTILGLPYEVDEDWFSIKPVVTWAFTGVMILLYIITVFEGDLFIRSFGFIPDQFFRSFGITAVSSFFLHASIFHLLGNLYFFLIFGDNVEDDIGPYSFVILLLVSHFFGLLLHSLFDLRGDIPVIGASAGISGILAYYAVTFPKKRIGFMFRILYFIRFLKVPSILYFGLWIIMQIVYSITQSTHGNGGVSALGHLGGIIIGLVMAFYVNFKRQNESE